MSYLIATLAVALIVITLIGAGATVGIVVVMFWCKLLDYILKKLGLYD